jgi:hypothetical protein
MIVLDSSIDFLFDAIPVFAAVLETDQVPVWILTLHSAQCWRDPFLLPFCDMVALCFNSFVYRPFQQSVAVPMP